MQEQVHPMFDDRSQTWTKLLVHDTALEVYKHDPNRVREADMQARSDAGGRLFSKRVFLSVNSIKCETTR